MSIRDKLISGTLGFGSAPPGNMFRNIRVEETATVDAAWTAGHPLLRHGATVWRPPVPDAPGPGAGETQSATSTCSVPRSAD
jgi:hypothetical protein